MEVGRSVSSSNTNFNPIQFLFNETGTWANKRLGEAISSSATKVHVQEINDSSNRNQSMFKNLITSIKQVKIVIVLMMKVHMLLT